MLQIVSCLTLRSGILAVVMLLSLGQQLSAETLEGADHPEFTAHLALWLSGEEAAPVAGFAELAQSDNLAAQVLLGLIDKRGALQGPETAWLTRTERIAQLRASGGLSGQNWVTYAAARSPFAQALADLWRGERGIELAQHFAKSGEDRACREALMTVAARRESGLLPAELETPWYPEGLRHLVYPRVLSPDAVEDLHAGDPQRRAAGELPMPDDLRDWLAAAPLAMPLRAACSTQCPTSQRACAHALYIGLGGYPAILSLGSPVAALVSDADFAASRRGQQAIARQIMLRYMTRAREQMLGKLQEVDSCTADWLALEFARYVPSRPASDAP